MKTKKSGDVGLWLARRYLLVGYISIGSSRGRLYLYRVFQRSATKPGVAYRQHFKTV